MKDQIVIDGWKSSTAWGAGRRADETAETAAGVVMERDLAAAAANDDSRRRSIMPRFRADLGLGEGRNGD
jgi:hypothetical protein